MKRLRYNLVIFGIFLISAAIIGRLICVQIMDNQYWSALGKGQQNIYEDYSGDRGKIFLKGNASPVATNQDVYYAYLSPAEIKEEKKTVEFLCQKLQLGEQEVINKLADKESLFIVAKEGLSDAEIESLKTEKIPGVYLDKKRKRYYPQQTFLSRVLGFVDKEGEGRYGIEGYYNDILHGQEGLVKGERGPRLKYIFFSDSEKGSDINLAIDYNIQFEAEKILKNAVDGLGAEGGQILVMDPNSGAVITMADYPNFDPNFYFNYAKEGSMGIFQNSATQKIFEPGSVLKSITMAMGLEEGKITPLTTYKDQGSVKIGGSTIYNFDNRKYDGDVTMKQVLEKSINTGAVFVESLIPHNIFLDYLEKFGFFEESGVDLPEVFSENKELKKGYEVNYATASFGQGIEMTPMQLVRAFCALVNGGRLPKPYLVQERTENGKTVQTEPEFSEQIISQKTSSQIASMMVSVVENGYGKGTRIPGYYIGGKTGTAQVAEGGKYSDEKTIQSFIGFAPAFSPKFVILVKIDNPKVRTAETSAVPVFHNLAKYIIDYKQIPPDYEL